MSAKLEDVFSVRSMEQEDLSQVMVIEEASYEFCWTERIFRDCMRAGYCCLVLSDFNDAIIGYAILMVGPHEGHVLNICIDQNYRGRGWARHLMREMIDFCERLQCEEIFLEVRPSNPVAYSLYQSMGFHDVGLRPGYYKAHNGKEDAIVMALPLNTHAKEPV